MTSPYVAYGPWTNGSSPPVDAAFLTALEAFLLAINSAAYDVNITANGAGVLSGITINASGGMNTPGIAVGANGMSSTGHIVLSNNVTFQIKDSGGTPHDVLYVDNANETCIQLANNTATLLIKDSSGGNLFRIDGSGNVRAKGTITASVTP